GMPSVMQITSGMPASAASRIESAAKRGGTKTIATFAPVSATLSRNVLKTGMPSTSCPALPGVTPATTLVPEFLLLVAWYVPSRPVMPETTSLVSLSIRTAISDLLPLRQGDDLLRRLVHGRRGVHVGQRRVRQDLAALDVVGAVEADHERDLRVELLERLD